MPRHAICCHWLSPGLSCRTGRPVSRNLLVNPAPGTCLETRKIIYPTRVLKPHGSLGCLQVSALEAQIRELQLVSEKKLMSVAQEAEAAARHERLVYQQEITALQVCEVACSRQGPARPNLQCTE